MDGDLCPLTVSSFRVIVENVIGGIKKWKILGNRWRGRVDNLQLLRTVFLLCSALTNIQKKLLDNEHDTEDEYESSQEDNQ